MKIRVMRNYDDFDPVQLCVVEVAPDPNAAPLTQIKKIADRIESLWEDFQDLDEDNDKFAEYLVEHMDASIIEDDTIVVSVG